MFANPRSVLNEMCPSQLFFESKDNPIEKIYDWINYWIIQNYWAIYTNIVILLSIDVKTIA